MEPNFPLYLTKLLTLGSTTLRKYPRLSKQLENINTKGEKSIAMDVKIQDLFVEYIKQENLPVTVYSEEIGVIKVHPHPTHILAFDPLDGSTNYRVGNNLLPYGILISVFRGVQPKIKDVIAAAALEYTQDLGFIFDGSKTYNLVQRPVVLKTDWPNEKSTPIYVDLHRRSYYDSYQNLAEKLYLRNTGSTVGNLSLVLSNVACGIGHPRIKAEEVGAVYGLIKGAGGIITDHNGRDLGEENYSFDNNYQLIGGCYENIRFAVNQLLQNGNLLSS